MNHFKNIHLNNIEHRLKNYLNNEQILDGYKIEKKSINELDSLILSFENTNKALLFIDAEDGYVEVVKYDGENKDFSDYMTNNNGGYSIEYHEIVDLECFVNYDIEDIVNSNELNNDFNR